MKKKKLFQIFLPLYNVEGEAFSKDLFDDFSKQFSEQFGGITAFSRSPVTGIWKKDGNDSEKDTLIIYEVIADHYDKQYWSATKSVLKHKFSQDEILIRCLTMEAV